MRYAMFKLMIYLVATYFILQVAFDIDVKESLEPFLAPFLEAAQEHTKEGFPELSKQFFENLSSQDLGELIKSQDFDLSQITSMLENQELNLDKLSELVESQEFDSEAAQKKLEELQKLVQEKLEKNQ